MTEIPATEPGRTKEIRTPEGYFVGFEPRDCGDHRTVGPHRAWCYDCSTWCYPRSPCPGCEVVQLRGQLALIEEFGGATLVISTEPFNDAKIEQACEVLHDAYEKAAAENGWQTQAKSRVPWAQVPEANKATMRVAVRALIDWLVQ